MFKSVANGITVFRILLVPIFLVLAYTDHLYWALAVYIIACVSDLADGYLARKFDQISDFGKFMDPLADKMLVFAAMCFFIEKGQMPGWVVSLLLCREFAVSGLRALAVGHGRVIAAGRSGKIKTVSTMLCLCLMLLFPRNLVINNICCVIILAVTVYSGVDYFVKNSDVFR